VQPRLNAAHCQLRQEASLANAAATNGFYHHSALPTHFKRSYGIAPVQFADAARARSILLRTAGN
jgi:AraC-like DNA-binding protein